MLNGIPVARLLPLGTKRLLCLIVGLSLLAEFFIWRNPVYRFAFVLNVLEVSHYPWTLLTCSFVETNLIVLAINLFCFASMGTYLERAFEKQSAFVQFVFTVALASTLCTFLVLLILTIFFHRDPWFYNMDVYGLAGVINSFSIAYKQFVPEHVLKLMGGFIDVRVKYIPSLLLVIQLTLLVVGLGRTSALQAIFGMVSAWVYLRFFRYHDGVRGDLSEHFSFTSFFADSLHGFVQPVSTATFRLFSALRLCPARPSSRLSRANHALYRQRIPLSPSQPVALDKQADIPNDVSGSAAASTTLFFNGEEPTTDSVFQSRQLNNAQRHKTLALQALDQQMHPGK